ncbi:MAG TPA: DUF456 domain-containing protein [Holophagaceae bacterium]|nr:DUF456 domain-containing protein [Holophagaceae bacterium]
MQAITPTFAWVVTLLCFTIGLLGVWLPLVPGLPLMALGATLFKMLQPERLSWITVILFILGAILGQVMELMASGWAAKKAGAGKAGARGALIGALAGLFFGLPGVLLGPPLGALLGEWVIRKQPFKRAAKAAVGAVIGLFAGALGKFILGWGLVLIFLVDAIWIHGR